MLISTTKHLLPILLLSLLLLGGCSTTPPVDSESFSLKSPRFGHAVVNDGQNVYVIAGSNTSGWLSDIEIIDPSTKQIEVLKDKLIPRRYFSAVWDGEHSIYIVGGISCEDGKYRFENRVEVFNTQTQEVTLAPNLPFPTRINSAVLLDKKIFVLGGAGRKEGKLTATPVVVALDLTKQKWLRAANMPTAKSTKAVVKDNFIYVVGGYDHKNSLNVFERFDLKSNTWESLPAMPAEISAHSTVVVKDKLFVFGNYHDMDATYSYDFSTKQWQELDIGYKASRHTAATTLHDTTYVIGGNTGGAGPYHDYIQTFRF